MSWGPALAGFAGGLAAGFLAALVAIRSAPDRLVRANVRGSPVPAVLGFGLVVAIPAGAFAVEFVVSLDDLSVTRLPGLAAVVLVAGIMFAGGLADDLRGDEADRGYRGHLRALRTGKVTGGIVKIAAGGVAGVVAALLVDGGLLRIAEAFLLVPLTANLFNLLDRAPGRAGKLGLSLAVLMAAASAGWAGAASGLIGGLVAVLPFDLSERGMLGDNGANVLGAVLGLGLVVILGEPFRAAAVVAVLALNYASERVSFSEVIERTAVLRTLDRMGRK